MRQFVGRQIEVEMRGEPPEPAVVTAGERRWEIARVERQWFDTGHGGIPESARTWRTRRHRKNFLLLAADGARLQVYYDYARDDRLIWQLVTVEEPPA